MGNKIAVDDELYSGISSEIMGLSGNLTGADLSPCFSGELASFYSGSCNTELDDEILGVIDDIENLSLNIDASIDAYKNIDDDLAYGLDALIDNIFGSSYENVDTTDGSSGTGNMSLEERKQYLQNLISSYEEALKSLEAEFEERYGAGLPYNSQDFKYVYPILYAMGLNVIDLSKFDKTGRMTYTAMKEIISFCDKQKVFERTIDYINGGSYKDTIGKIDFGDGMYDDPNNTEEDWNEAELEFLRRVASCYGRNVSNDPMNMESNKSMVISLLVEDGIITSEGNKYKFANLDFIESSREQIEIYDRYVKDIQTLSSTIYNYKQAMLLLPYQSFMEDDEFKEFLSKDFEKLKAKYKKLLGANADYLQDDEIALYAYLSEHVSSTDAEGYLSAMTDTLNNRKGLVEALKYIAKLNEGGYDFGDEITSMLSGFGDGVTSFLEGIGKFFNPSGTRTINDYIMYYKVAILSDPDKFNLDLTKAEIDLSLNETERNALKITYNIFSGVGNMIIPQLITLAGMGIAAITEQPEIAVIFRNISSVLMATSVAGKSINSSLASGHGILESYLYGVLSGASESLFERLGGIIGIGSGGDSLLASSGLLDSIKRFLVSIGQEGVEEFFQEYFDDALKAIILGEPFDLSDTTNNALIAGLYGMAVAGVMNTGTVITIKIGGKIVKFFADELSQLDLSKLDPEQSAEDTINELYNEQIAQAMEIVNSEHLDTLDTALDYIRSSNLTDVEKSRLLDATVQSLISDTNNDTQAIVKLYSELVRILHYDESVTTDMSNALSRVDSSMDLLNMPDGDNVVCSEFASIFRDLLIRAGLSEENVHIMSAKNIDGSIVHQWVEIDLGDGNIMIADAADYMNGRTDFTSAKAGLDFVGLAILDKKYSKTRLRDAIVNGVMYVDGKRQNTGMSGIDLIKSGRLKIKDVVTQLGPLNLGEYEIVEGLFENIDFEDRSIDDKIDLINQILEDTELTSFELYHILRKLNQEIIKTQLPDGTYRLEIRLRDPSDGTVRTVIVEHGKMTEG